MDVAGGRNTRRLPGDVVRLFLGGDALEATGSSRPCVCGVEHSSKTCLPSLRARVIGWIRTIPTGAPFSSEAVAAATSISQVVRVGLPSHRATCSGRFGP